MTRLVDLPSLAHMVRRFGVGHCLRALAQRIEADFCRWEAFEKSARLAHHSAVGVIELMPVSDGLLYSFKYVNGHPGNPALGLPTVMAFSVLADVATGVPLLLCEATLLTALRTAATSALAARALARADSRCMALIGCGAQGEFQALAFHAVLGLESLVFFDTDPVAMDKLQRNLAQAAPTLQLQRAASVQEALQCCDIVTTATAAKQHAAVLTAEMLRPGLHINAVGGDCPGKTELAPEVLQRARLFVEFEPQTRTEGEIQQLPATHPVTALWQVLTGQAAGRGSAQDITLFDSVGFALEDHAALCWVAQLAQEQGLGQMLSLVPAAGAPKDLFAATLGA